MTRPIINSRAFFWITTLVTVLLSGSMTFMHLGEFYKVSVLRQLSASLL